jgi:hypothetical protein
LLLSNVVNAGSKTGPSTIIRKSTGSIATPLSSEYAWGRRCLEYDACCLALKANEHAYLPAIGVAKGSMLPGPIDRATRKTRRNAWGKSERTNGVRAHRNGHQPGL